MVSVWMCPDFGCMKTCMQQMLLYTSPLVINVRVFCSFQNLSVGLNIVLEHTRSLASTLNSRSSKHVYHKSFQDAHKEI